MAVVSLGVATPISESVLGGAWMVRAAQGLALVYMVYGVILLRLGRVSSATGQQVIRTRPALDAGTREVAAKLFEITIFAVIVLLLLNVMGIDLTGLFDILRNVVGSHPQVLSGEGVRAAEHPDAEIACFGESGKLRPILQRPPGGSLGGLFVQQRPASAGR